MKNYFILLLLLMGSSISSIQVSAHSSQEFEKVSITIGDKKLILDYANTPELRAHGLQHKKVLCDDCGMLFELEKSRVTSFGMKDTFLPLDIAFIQKDGEIVHVAQLQPFDTSGESSLKAVFYAVEMNQGWFAEHGITVGDKVTIIPSR